MDIDKNDELRASKGLLTTSVVHQLVTECIGNIPVLCIVGRCRTGKTWAITDWIASHTNSLEHIAYVDCQKIAFGNDAALKFADSEQAVRKGHYPKLALDGVDIVVVDEPRVNRAFVKTLISLTAPTAGTAAHRLVVLLLQAVHHVDEFEMNPKQYRCYTIAGLPTGPVQR